MRYASGPGPHFDGLWPELPPAPDGWAENLRSGFQLTRYFAKCGRRDVMIPDIARSSWSRCFGLCHEDDRTRWYRPFESGVFNLTRKQYYCSVRCATEEGATPSGNEIGEG